MAGNYYGEVTRVIDGDTFQVKDKFGNTQTIRLFGIDTPEKKQTFGLEAKEYTKKLIDKKTVHVQTVELGKYGRIVAIVHINNQSLSEILLSDGIAFASGSNHKLANRYFALQEKARVNNQGLHKLGIENPSLFRKKQQSRNPTFMKSKFPEQLPVPRFKPAKPKFLDGVKKFFANLLEKSAEYNAKREQIKKIEKERIEQRILNRKLANEALEENNKSNKNKQPESSSKSIEKDADKIDTSVFMQRFKERSKKM